MELGVEITDEKYLTKKHSITYQYHILFYNVALQSITCYSLFNFGKRKMLTRHHLRQMLNVTKFRHHNITTEDVHVQGADAMPS